MADNVTDGQNPDGTSNTTPTGQDPNAPKPLDPLDPYSRNGNPSDPMGLNGGVNRDDNLTQFGMTGSELNLQSQTSQSMTVDNVSSDLRAAVIDGDVEYVRSHVGAASDVNKPEDSAAALLVAQAQQNAQDDQAPVVSHENMFGIPVADQNGGDATSYIPGMTADQARAAGNYALADQIDSDNQMAIEERELNEGTENYWDDDNSYSAATYDDSYGDNDDVWGYNDDYYGYDDYGFDDYDYGYDDYGYDDYGYDDYGYDDYGFDDYGNDDLASFGAGSTYDFGSPSGTDPYNLSNFTLSNNDPFNLGLAATGSMVNFSLNGLSSPSTDPYNLNSLNFDTSLTGGTTNLSLGTTSPSSFSLQDPTLAGTTTTAPTSTTPPAAVTSTMTNLLGSSFTSSALADLGTVSSSNGQSSFMNFNTFLQSANTATQDPSVWSTQFFNPSDITWSGLNTSIAPAAPAATPVAAAPVRPTVSAPAMG